MEVAARMLPTPTTGDEPVLVSFIMVCMVWLPPIVDLNCAVVKSESLTPPIYDWLE